MKKWIVLILLGGFLLPSISQAIDLKQSKFTQVVNNVEVIASADKSRHSAAVNDVFKMPDVLRTGPDSRAELVAPDNTITRVGANTIFSFDPANRTIDLQQGSILFHSPHGKGGGTIRTGSATASVIGTTIIVTSTPGGGFKLLDLEGQAEIRFLNGLHRTLEPGQMTFILPGGSASPIVVFRLDSQTKGSLLVNGFDAPLPSIGKIEAEITRQLLQLLNNQAQDSGLLVGNNATPDSVQVRMDLLDETPPSRPSGFQGDSSVIGSDHVSGLPVNYSPLDPTHVANNSFTPPNIDSINQGLDFLGITTPASGFVGNNIDIDTANVDLSSFAGKSDFEFMASGDIKIWQSVNFTPVIDEPLEGPPPIIIAPDTISLIAGGQMLIASGSTLEADTGTFGLVADSFGTLDTDSGTVGEANTLDDVRIINHVGDVDILSLQDLSVLGSSICAGGGVDIESQNGSLNIGQADLPLGDDEEEGTTINARNGDLTITAGGSISISDGDLEAHSSDSASGDDEPSVGNVTISGTGSVGIDNNTYIYGDGNVDISSSGTISLNTEGSSSSGTIDIEDSEIEAGGCVGVTADGTVYFSGDDITADSGRIAISGGGNVSIYSSTINANGSVDITSGGTLIVGSEGSVSALDDGYDVSISAGGNARLSADAGGDVDVTDTSISAGGNVCITTCGTISLGGDDTVAIGGNIDLEDSSVTAGSSINVTANDGGVTINDTTLTAGSDYQDIVPSGLSSDSVDIASTGGDITVSATGTADISDSTLDVSGDISISGDSSISSEEADATISGGGGSVSISGNEVSIDDAEIMGNNISISSSDISATDGSVNITDGGSIAISGRTVSIDDGSSISANNITINSGSDISAENGDVNITDNGSLTISGNCTAEISDSTINVNNITISGSTITSDGCKSESDINIIDNGTACIPSGEDSDAITVDAISINGSTVAAAAGNVNITANGDVTIDGSDISASSGVISLSESDTETVGGTVNITSNDGDVDTSEGSISANGGDVNINAGGSVDLEHTDVSADGSVNVNAGGSVNVYNTDLCMNDWNVDAGSYVGLGAGDSVHISDSTITAEGEDVGITSFDGEISVCDSTITADTSVTLTANGDVSISDDSTITAEGGDVSITSEGTAESGLEDSVADSVSISDSTISATGTVDISAGGDVAVCDSQVYFGSCDNTKVRDDDYAGEEGDVCITAGGGEMTINAGGMVTLKDAVFHPEGNISVCDADVSTVGGSINFKTGGDIDVTAGCLSVCGVVIEGGGVSISDSDVTACGGDVNIGGDGQIIFNGGVYTGGGYTAVAGDVTICDSDVAANGGCVNINSGGDVEAYDSTISASEEDSVGGNVNISTTGDIGIHDTDIEADGSVNLNAGGSVIVCNDNAVCMNDWNVDAGTCVTVDAGDNVHISDSTITAEGGDVSITSEGTAESGLEDSVADSVSISDSTISATGTVDISAGGDVAVCDSQVYFGSCDNTKVRDDDYAGEEGDVCITAGGGEMTINAGGMVTLKDAVFHPEGNISVCDADVSTVGGSINFKTGGDIDVTAGCLSVCGVVIEGGGVSISDSDVTACGGDVNIGGDGQIIFNGGVYTGGGYTAVAGDVTICDSDVAANGGCVNINSGGDVEAYDSTISASEEDSVGGNVNISTTGDIGIHDTDIEADGSVNLNAGGSVIVCNDNAVCMNDWNVDAGTCVTVDAGDNVNISDSTITAESGDVAITSNDGGQITVSSSDITASGNICISSEGTISLSGASTISGGGNIDLENSTLSAGDSVYMNASGNVTVNDSTVNFGNGSDQVLSDGAPGVQSGVQSGDVDISTTGGTGQVVICADGQISLQNSVFHANEGNISISDYHTTSANGGVNIQTGGEVDLYGGGLSMSGVEVVGGSISISDGSAITANGGDINIGGDGQIFFNTHGVSQSCGYTAVAGDISISDSAIISSVGDVNINSGGTVTVLGSDGDCVISGNNVNLTADGDVDLYGADISARAGDLNISAGGVLDIEDDFISSGSTTLSGDNVTLTGGAGINLDWNSGSGVTITANDGTALIEAQDGDVLAFGATITASGCANIYADYGNVDLESTTVTTTGGNVDIEAGRSDLGGSETLTLNNDTITAGGSVTLSAQGNGNLNQDEGGITISGTSINANTTSGMICVNNASGVTTIDNGSSMHAFYITVNSPDGIMFDGSSGDSLSRHALKSLVGKKAIQHQAVSSGGSLSGNTLNLIAGMGDSSDDTSGGHSVTVQDTDLGQLSTVNIQAHTVNLNNDNFSSSSSYNFTSFYGGYHINDGNVGGYVNFNNDTLDGSAITSSDAAGTVNPNNNGGIVLGGSGAGIHIH